MAARAHSDPAALRVGYIVDAGSQSQLVHDLIRRGVTSGSYTAAVLIVQRPAARREPSPASASRSGDSRAAAPRRPGTGVTGLLERVLFSATVRLEQLLVAQLTGYREQSRRHPLERLGIPLLEVDPLRSDDDCAVGYADEDIARIAELGLDVLFHASSAEDALAGAVLDACRFGVIALRVGSGDAAGNAPAAFAEVYHRRPSTRFTIERLRPAPAPPDVLFAGSLNTAPLYLLNAVNVTRKAVVFADRFLTRLAQEQRLPEPQRQRVGDSRTSALPSFRRQLTYLTRTFLHSSERAVRRLLGARWRWGVAYTFSADWADASLTDVRPIPNPPHRYFADPCVVVRDDVAVCYVEDYDCRTSQARISALRLHRDGWEELGVALEEPFHLSFPFVFKAGEDLYMCPESAEAREIRLYRCVEFPLRWELHRVLMRDVAAVDTTIVHHGGRWWMLTNIDSAGIDDYRSELHVFHADSFDSESWQAHRSNPVVFDSARARNGGLIATRDGLYRVYQVQGFDVYGQSMGVARITELSPERYTEQTVREIGPTFLAGIVGTHTLSWAGGVLAVDYVRRERC